MVLQKPTRFKGKSKVRKTVSHDTEDHKRLAGPREAVALEVLHMMFLKEVAKNSNFVAFQKKKNVVDNLSLKNGIQISMKKCFDDKCLTQRSPCERHPAVQLKFPRSRN